MAPFSHRAPSRLAHLPYNPAVTRLNPRTMSRSALSAPLISSTSPSTKIPKLIYGTAWKKERTADLVYQAIKAGFRGVDTAAQPKHYQEALVGDGIRRAIEEGLVKREDLYIQTKFTPLSGQDLHNMPYSASQPLPERIHTSLTSSFSNLRLTSTSKPEDTYIDCLVLHSPLPTLEETHLAWRTFSTYVPHRIRTLGISNTTLQVLQSLYAEEQVKPSVVQNRFYPATRWEAGLRRWCRERGIVFQSFWTLSGNPKLVDCRPVRSLAGDSKNLGVVGESERMAVALYALVLGLEGVSVLDGTTREIAMKGDLKGLESLSKWAEGEGSETWKGYLREFKGFIGEAEYE